MESMIYFANISCKVQTAKSIRILSARKIDRLYICRHERKSNFLLFFRRWRHFNGSKKSFRKALMWSDDPRFFGIGGVTIWNNRDTKDKVYLQIHIKSHTSVVFFH